MNIVRAHLFIYGDVIGVGFRYWAVGKARKLGLKGWVRNLPDSVEAVFEGPKDKVLEMVELCREGPPVSDVTNVDVEWEDCKGEFEDFEIRY